MEPSEHKNNQRLFWIFFFLKKETLLRKFKTVNLE